MKFFFPDSQDQIDPSFDFASEERASHRVRQRDDRYAHEALAHPPFDGILVSKTVVDGTGQATGRYTLSQRHRLYRDGARRFFRLDYVDRTPLQSMGDCGAFSYVRDHVPPYSPEEIVAFYAECDFDLGVSVDHVIPGFDPAADSPAGEVDAEWRRRQQLTLELAAEFLNLCTLRVVRFEPVGVAQGWSPRSYATAVRQLQQMGYRRVALGGIVPLKTHEILACLQAVGDIRHATTQLHLLGICRCDSVGAFASYGVTSFDSTSPFRQAFKDDRANYYTLDRTFTAIRVPQVDHNPRLKARVRAGRIRQAQVFDLEQACLRLLHAYDAGTTPVDPVLDALRAYNELFDGGHDRTGAYRELLDDRPWQHCPCGICSAAGIDVAIFRGSERNKRRGFHNLFVFRQRLQRELATITI